MNGCEHCREVYIESSVNSPGDFKKAIRIVNSNLSDGTIIESNYWPEGTINICKTPFNQVTGNGVYTEDTYIYYFECPKCHQLFELTCDIYHGSGGKWRPLRENDL